MIDILYTDASGAVRSISVIDVSETHLGTAEPTDSPVEDGVDITDHIRPKQREFSAQCFVSNTLIEAAPTQMDGATETTESIKTPTGALSVVAFSGEIRRAKLVYDEIEALRTSGRVCTIVTGLRRYENMCITSASFPVDNTDGILFDLAAREVRIVTTQRSGTPRPRDVRGHRSTNGGTQPTTPAPASTPQRRESLWHRLLG